MRTVTGINGRVYKWNLSYYNVFEDETRPRSQYHKVARELLKKLYGSFTILEEVQIPGSRNPLCLDFFIPNLDLAVEVHGEQHYKYIPFFHKTKAKFFKSLKRDTVKEDWCLTNNIRLVVLKYDEQDKWRNQLSGI
jgi:hypothetical protein